MTPNTKRFSAALICAPALLLSACGGSDSDGSSDSRVIATGLPEGLSLSLLDASDGAFYAYDTSSETRTDINAKAAASQDEAVQDMAITDTSVIGSFLVWPDDGEEPHDHAAKAKGDHDHEHEEGALEAKYLLMQPGYQRGAPIDADDFSVLVHFHDDDLAAHTADEYRDAEDGSNLAEELERLNHYVEEQAELHAEVAEAMTAEGQTLCRAYVDPYLAAEHGHAHAGEPAADPAMAGEEHAELVHYALSDSGRVYFFEEHDGALEKLQSSFVKLDNTSSILDCSRTSIARVSEEGVLIFVPDTQMLYLVDAHDGADFHQHSTWSVGEILPAGTRADLVAIVGEGEDHDHDHDHAQ